LATSESRSSTEGVSRYEARSLMRSRKIGWEFSNGLFHRYAVGAGSRLKP
jgi:hypothetical protein